MLFNTIEFGLFFALVWLIYTRLPWRAQNTFLLVASYAFYAAWDYRFLALIFISTAVDFYVGKVLHRTTSDRRRKHILYWSVLFNLGFLGFFKYFNFFAENLQTLLTAWGFHPSLSTLQIVLPVGISFYTFQSLSYTIDIYRRQMEPTGSFFDFALNVAFFPHMVAGPIQRAHSLLDQITSPRHVTADNITEGTTLILWGLVKKMVIADNMSLIADAVFSQNGGFSAGQVWIGMLAFAFQIYGDFSGYTDIARGTAKLMGFELMVNFNLPYFAENPQDFWRRWHISLSTWLRDYLYISLGGSRGSSGRTYVNLVLTMILGGLWHGAAWTFVVWGCYHGALLAIHRFIQQNVPRRATPLSPFAAGVWKWTRIAFMFVLTLYGWLIFRAKNLDQLGAMTSALFTFHIAPGTYAGIAKILAYCAPLIAMQFYQYKRRDLDAVRSAPVLVQCAFYVLCFYLIILLGVFNAQSFIYFQF